MLSAPKAVLIVARRNLSPLCEMVYGGPLAFPASLQVAGMSIPLMSATR